MKNASEIDRLDELRQIFRKRGEQCDPRISYFPL